MFNLNQNSMREIKDVKILGVEIDFYCPVPHGCLNLGVVRLECEGREFVTDTVASRWLDMHNNSTRVELDLEVVDFLEEDPENKFDLNKFDLVNPDLKATIWFEEAVEVSKGEFVDPDSQTLFVQFLKQDGSGGMVKAIDLEVE